MTTSFYDLECKDKKGESFKFDQLKGKVVLIVNVASKCGFTPQYKELEELYKNIKIRGLLFWGSHVISSGSRNRALMNKLRNFAS
ncbi:ANM_HP_G0004000.mRNA.1.CDS.1 [Saccharomyces cerevisiae]|nr:ANM_HP_G0107570.mRNA.1.CDS.1 [Saccharomyces cerevisiae]CAI4949219.1 ANM_HP_G0125300.mRNA.1.CDS.1 [Saccharomyces cerevisiae]CAI5141997.1 ANM_HP_G0228740.mRNA.1.CDS.1 [Saccharomyces cerevisiae]CAI5217483.1 ANM_HP_G0025160.mRNA.1.CDS.1 [Saccharomyces cerevisiae]CAI5224827.1 ANM_HP_G0004000.mRNA.1.CDS.1 [Saccharomyces cerevisiae]